MGSSMHMDLQSQQTVSLDHTVIQIFVLDNFVLMDCGEGTLLQLYRIFGTSRGRHILSNLKAVYVSHLHADHHMGLINVVLERSKVFKIAGRDVEKLFIIGPRLISQYLTFYHHNFEPILTDLYPIQNEHLLYFHPEHRKFLKLDSVMLVSSLFSMFSYFKFRRSLKIVYCNY